MNEITSRLSTALADRYRIERRLGEGGMATVYLAEDLKHKRKVAVKVLRPELAAVLGAERFVQEITTTANLQHPHILPLFDSGEADGFLYYVMPFIDGETLRDKLNRETQLGIDEAVGITTDIAGALHYAHGEGVIHRDIKPENILIHNGRPMVADFGIALAVSAAAGGRMTETGLSLGTPHYMSPEQATAEKDLTNRSDIYSLGSVLYEMLTGEPPHVGGSAQAIIMKIVTEPADPVTKIRKSVPPHVAAATAKSLEKLAADRFASAATFAEALTNPAFRQRELVPTGPTDVQRWNWLKVGLAGVMGLAAGLLLFRGDAPTTPQSPFQARFEVPVPGGVVMTGGQESPLALSPDGTLLAFVTPQGIAIRPIDSFEARVLPNTKDATMPMFSPDGSRIAFMQTSYLRWVPVGGGGAVTVAYIGTPGGVGSSWSANGGFLVTGVGTNGILWVPEEGGEPTQITEVLTDEGENIHAWPTDLPGTDAILYTALGPGGGWADGKTVLFDPQTGTRDVLVVGGTNAQYSPTGHLLYVDASGTVFARSFDLATREWMGTAVPVVSGVRTGNWGGGAGYHVSKTGVLAWITGSEFETHQFVAIDRSGTVVEDLGLESGAIPQLSHDGRRLLFGVANGNNIDLWIMDLASGERDRFTFDINEEESAVWSPGDDRIMWAAAQPGGGRRVYVQPVDRSGEREVVFEHPYHLHLTDWSSDERYVAFYDFHPTEGENVYLVDLEDSARVIPVAAANDNEADGTFSPDGQWLTYWSDETGRAEVFAIAMPEGGQKRQLSSGGGFQPNWDQQQRELYYLTSGWASSESPTLVARSVRSGSTLDLGPQDFLFTLPTAVYFEPSLDGRRFYTYLARAESRAYSIKVLLNSSMTLGGSDERMDDRVTGRE